MTKEINNNELLKIIEKRFDGVDKRFDGVDKRFDGVDKRFDGIDGEIKSLKKDNEDLVEVINKSFSELEAKMDKRFQIIENDLDDVKLKLDNVVYRFEINEVLTMMKRLQKQINFLNKKVGVR